MAKNSRVIDFYFSNGQQRNKNACGITVKQGGKFSVFYKKRPKIIFFEHFFDLKKNSLFDFSFCALIILWLLMKIKIFFPI